MSPSLLRYRLLDFQIALGNSGIDKLFTWHY